MTELDDELMAVSVPVLAPGRVASLTEAERAVVARVLEGASNAEIAAERGTSARTVANQLAAVYRKLGALGRAELAALVTPSITDE